MSIYFSINSYHYIFLLITNMKGMIVLTIDIRLLYLQEKSKYKRK